jgi:hypothetical protein
MRIIYRGLTPARTEAPVTGTNTLGARSLPRTRSNKRDLPLWHGIFIGTAGAVKSRKRAAQATQVRLFASSS